MCPRLRPAPTYIGIFCALFNTEIQEAIDNQKLFVININNYVYLVPFVEDEEKVFLKTIIPSRKATKKYLVKGVKSK